VSTEYHLLTRERPTPGGLALALREAAEPGTVAPTVDGDLTDPNSYLTITGPGTLIELEPPGHVEAADLDGHYPDGTTLPLPDAHQCLWLTVATIPATAPPGSDHTAWRLLQDLALRYDGTTLDPAE
jgi:hypothetical protein